MARPLPHELVHLHNHRLPKTMLLQLVAALMKEG